MCELMRQGYTSDLGQRSFAIAREMEEARSGFIVPKKRRPVCFTDELINTIETHYTPVGVLGGDFVTIEQLRSLLGLDKKSRAAGSLMSYLGFIPDSRYINNIKTKGYWVKRKQQ